MFLSHAPDASRAVRRWICALALLTTGSHAELPPTEIATASSEPGLRQPVATWAFLHDKPDGDGGRLRWGEIGETHSDAQLDLPIEPSYIAAIEQSGFQIRTRSRWLNAVSVLTDSEGFQQLRGMTFVRELRAVKKRRRLPVPGGAEHVGGEATPKALAPHQDYGPSFEQMSTTGVTLLHNLGYRGAGMTIALLDAGFNHREHKVFSSLRVRAVRDFVNGDSDVSDEVDEPVTGDEISSGHNLHGTRVLSLIGGLDPGSFIGAAPEAEFILAKTEDNTQELSVEEDRWIAGLEWADSLGADVLNSSIGYNLWDEGGGYTVDDLDGQTALTTIAAQAAISRGMTIVAAAGNEANTSWQYVTVPADGEDVITVGAVDLTLRHQIASFSSHGPTADGRIKPDVVAPGVAVVVASGKSASAEERNSFAVSDYVRISGTSFAAPIVSGICAILLQIHPTWGPADVARALRQNAVDLGVAGPDTLYGWGLVDAAAASGVQLDAPGQTLAAAPFPNPAVLGEGLNRIFFPLQLSAPEDVEVSIFDLSGSLVARPIQQQLEAGDYLRPECALSWNVPDKIDGGIYLYRVESATVKLMGKIAIVRDSR